MSWLSYEAAAAKNNMICKVKWHVRNSFKVFLSSLLHCTACYSCLVSKAQHIDYRLRPLLFFSYSDEERRFMYKINLGHLTVFCIVFVWLGGPPSPVRIITQVPWFMYQNRLGPSGGIYYPNFVPCFVVLYLNNINLFIDFSWFKISQCLFFGVFFDKKN